METILADPENRIASVKIMLTSVEDQSANLKNEIWFVTKRHQTENLSKIILDTLYSICYHWYHIILYCPYMDSLRCQL